jgi:hypothetical protein
MTSIPRLSRVPQNILSIVVLPRGVWLSKRIQVPFYIVFRYESLGGDSVKCSLSRKAST